MAERAARFILATNETSGEMLGLTKIFENGIGCSRKILKEIQELLFPDVDAKYYDQTKKMLAVSENLCIGKLGRIDAVKHCVDLM